MSGCFSRSAPESGLAASGQKRTWGRGVRNAPTSVIPQDLDWHRQRTFVKLARGRHHRSVRPPCTTTKLQQCSSAFLSLGPAR
jgi:hypothetical protein